MIYIGIDPDTDKSGVAVWNSKEKTLEVKTMRFFELMDWLKGSINSNCIVIIEAGWLNKKSNFHDRAYQSKAAGESIAKRVGANHEAGRKIVEMCEYLNIGYQLVIPKVRKTTSEQFEYITGMKVKNQEMIDAGMLVFGR